MACVRITAAAGVEAAVRRRSGPCGPRVSTPIRHEGHAHRGSRPGGQRSYGVRHGAAWRLREVLAGTLLLLAGGHAARRLCVAVTELALLLLLARRICLGVCVRTLAASVTASEVALLIRVEVMQLQGASSKGVAAASKAEREGSPPSADARASGVTDVAARLAAGLGTTDTACSGAPWKRGCGAAGWASESCAAEGKGVAAAASPSLDDEVDDVCDSKTPAALPPGAGHLRRSRQGRRLSFLPKTQTAESAAARA